MSLVSVGWPFFRSPGLWDKFDLECILCKRDQLFKLNNMFSTAEIVNSDKQHGTGALLIVNNCILGFIFLGIESIYLFDSHSKGENGNLSNFSAVVSLHSDRLYPSENCIRLYFCYAYLLTCTFK